MYGTETGPSSLTVTNSTISGNSAVHGGGILCTYNCFAKLTNSTISRNRGSSDEGSVDNFGTLVLKGTLISGNTGGCCSSGTEVDNSGSITSKGFNLFGHKGLNNGRAFRGLTPGPTDITATSNGSDPTALSKILNTTLANNGGPTRTHALVAGSPAIDMVTDGTCPPPATDQRGVRRLQDGNNDGAAICDTGSFERR